MKKNKSAIVKSTEMEALPSESVFLQNLLKTSEIEKLFEACFHLTQIPVSIIDMHGNALLPNPWHRLCAKFSLPDVFTTANCSCEKSITAQLEEGTSYTIYSCNKGLKECVAPIKFDGKKIANLIIGQFFTSESDRQYFLSLPNASQEENLDLLSTLKSIPLIDENRLQHIVELFIKITTSITKLAVERKNVLESQERQSIIINTIPQSVFWKDINGRYLGCNYAFAKSAGLSTPREIIGKTDFDLPWPKTEAERYRADDAAVISAGVARLHIIEPVQQADGSRILVDTSKVPLSDSEGQTPYGVLGIYENITEREVIEQELEQYRKNLEQIVYERTRELQVKNLQLENGIKEWQLAEAARLESETKYQTLVNQSSSIILEWDPQGTVLYLNPYGLELFGFTKEEIFGRNVVGTIVAPIDSSGADLRLKMEQVQREPDSFYSSENENLRKNGEPVWVAWTNRGIYDANGSLVKTISIGIDRTQQKAAERQLHTQYLELQEEIAKRKEAEAKLWQINMQLEERVEKRTLELKRVNKQLELDVAERVKMADALLLEKAFSDTVINSLPGIFYMFDKEGNLIRWNDEFSRLTGVTSENAIKHKLLDRVIDNYKEKVRAAVEGAYATGQTEVDAEVAADGSIRHFHFVARRLAIKAQNYLVGTGYDITEHKQVELKLRESEILFRTAFMTGVVAFVLVEEESGRLLEVNDHFLQLYGFKREEVIGRTSLELGMWATPETRSLLLQELQLRGQVENFEVLAQSKDGEHFWVLYSVNRLNIKGIPLMLGAILDISARKDAEERTAEYASQLANTLESTLQAVATMVEMRDPYTAGHERRVGIIAADIAREMGWTEERCHQLELIGIVHDIGKIAIPAEILVKPARLSSLEYEIVKTHAERGFEILRNVRSSMPVAEIVYQHHERLDGSGYPRGLKGDQILIEAKILAVADVIESMASHRPYRPALGLETALAEIENHRGVWFDEDVVNAMLYLIREKGYLLPT